MGNRMGLTEFANFLQQCLTMMQDMPALGTLKLFFLFHGPIYKMNDNAYAFWQQEDHEEVIPYHSGCSNQKSKNQIYNESCQHRQTPWLHF